MSSSDAETEQPKQSTWVQGLLGFLRDLVVILVIAFTVSFLLKTFLIRSFYIPSGSMEETLQVNDTILVNQLVPDVVGVKRGDVVVFEDPGGWLNLPASVNNPDPTAVQSLLQIIGLSADTSTDYVVKRVIGVGGDHVMCCDESGRVVVNGEPLDEPYAVIPEGYSRASEIDFDVVVPEGSVWVMGDNRYSSRDSRYNQDQPGRGFVDEAEIVGRAFVINWPVSRWGVIGNYPETFANIPAGAGLSEDASPSESERETSRAQ